MKAHWKHLALTLVIGWFLGAASGLVIMHICHERDMNHGPSARGRERLYKELDLNADQRTKVEAILQTSRQTLDGLFVETQARIEEVHNNTRAQIRQLLTPAQQAAFDKLHAKWEVKHKRNLDELRHHF
jgi:Spy/CpxP family protein refolding chaperone